MELETSEDQEVELKAIVQKAQTWRFPTHPQDGVQLVLSADGFTPTWTTWQGPECFWAEFCPYCGEHRNCKEVDPPNERCTEVMRLRKEHMGPLCHVASLRWKIQRKSEVDEQTM